MSKYDYFFFEAALSERRLLKSYTNPYYLFDAIPNIFDGMDSIKPPKMLYAKADPRTLLGTFIFETSSYASTPGHGMEKLRSMVGQELPEDFTSFYHLYEKALIVTRGNPIHLWHEEKMLESIHRFREDMAKPFRMFRFGEQYNREATHYALWLEEPDTMKWRVISTAVGYIDDRTERDVHPGQILAPSFIEWLQDLLRRDGLPDPFLELGPEGGFIDPVTEEDMELVRGSQAVE